MDTREVFSPWYNPNRPPTETGRRHLWQKYDGTYYGPAWECRNCSEKSKGWNIWKEDLLRTCPGPDAEHGPPYPGREITWDQYLLWTTSAKEKED